MKSWQGLPSGTPTERKSKEGPIPDEKGDGKMNPIPIVDRGSVRSTQYQYHFLIEIGMRRTKRVSRLMSAKGGFSPGINLSIY